MQCSHTGIRGDTLSSWQYSWTSIIFITSLLCSPHSWLSPSMKFLEHLSSHSSLNIALYNSALPSPWFHANGSIWHAAAAAAVARRIDIKAQCWWWPTDGDGDDGISPPHCNALSLWIKSATFHIQSARLLCICPAGRFGDVHLSIYTLLSGLIPG